MKFMHLTSEILKHSYNNFKIRKMKNIIIKDLSPAGEEKILKMKINILKKYNILINKKL